MMIASMQVTSLMIISALCLQTVPQVCNKLVLMNDIYIELVFYEEKINKKLVLYLACFYDEKNK